MKWLRARLADSWFETRTAKTLVFDVSQWTGHEAGQHVDLRLTAPNGYSAQRSYSVASSCGQGELALTVENLGGGEVSPYLVQTMEPGDELELRGPIGGWFAWSAKSIEPVLLIAGGSGIVPLMSMIRERNRVQSTSQFRLLYSVRTPDHIYYADELSRIGDANDGVTVDVVYSRSAPPADSRGAKRLSADDVASAAMTTGGGPSRTYICGPTAFVEHAAQLLLATGYPPGSIRTERFGATGG